MRTARETNTFLIKIYTYMTLLNDTMEEFGTDTEDAVKLQEVLQLKCKAIESADVKKLFTSSGIAQTLQKKLEYNIEKEFSKLQIQLAKRK